jgi:putative peptide zinc metalloprotease protein
MELHPELAFHGNRNGSVLVSVGSRFFEVSHDVGDVLEAVNEERCPESAASRLAAKWGRPVTATQVRDIAATAAFQPFREGAANARDDFDMGFTIFSAHVTQILSVPFGPLFTRTACTLLIVAALGVLVALEVTGVPLIPRWSHSWDAWLYAIVLVSAVAHEFGHAAAARSVGARVGAIGASLYFIFPVLHCDVSRTWALSRGRRFIVSAGGFYVQAWIIVVSLAMEVITRDRGWGGVAQINLLFIAYNLNPLIKLDGYWLLSDALNISNLSQRSATFLKSGWRTRPWTRSHWFFAMYAVAAGAYLVWIVLFISGAVLRGVRAIVTSVSLSDLLWASLKTAFAAVVLTFVARRVVRLAMEARSR